MTGAVVTVVTGAGATVVTGAGDGGAADVVVVVDEGAVDDVGAGVVAVDGEVVLVADGDRRATGPDDAAVVADDGSALSPKRPASSSGVLDGVGKSVEVGAPGLALVLVGSPVLVWSNGCRRSPERGSSFSTSSSRSSAGLTGGSPSGSPPPSKAPVCQIVSMSKVTATATTRTCHHLSSAPSRSDIALRRFITIPPTTRHGPDHECVVYPAAASSSQTIE